MKPILKSYLIEVNVGNTIPGNGSNINFQDYPQLRNVYFTGAIVCDTNTATISPSGKSVIANTVGITITLLDKFNMEVTHQYPSKDLNPYYTSGIYRDFVPFPIQLTKSYITILDNAGIAANESFLINVFYYTEKDWATLQAKRK